jgi:ABC-type branched-subunit amino acid transport system ATPase component
MSSAEARDPVRPPLLQADGLVAGYGGAPVIDGVSLAVAGGQVLAIVGPNGAGKSTLLKAMLGIVQVRSGSVQLKGKDITSLPLEDLARLGVGYVPQGDDVFDTLRVHENLEMGGFILGRRERAERIAAVLGVFPQLRGLLSRYAGTLSGGERKMVAVARVLMPDPQVLLLDEPTAGLSPELTRHVLEDQVRLLAGLDKAVVIVEQKADAALRVADAAVVLVSGRVALRGTGMEILQNPEVGEIFLRGKEREAPPVS